MTIRENSRPFSYAGVIIISCFFERTRIVSNSSCASDVSLDLLLKVFTAARALLLRRIAKDAYCMASLCSNVVLQDLASIIPEYPVEAVIS